LCFFTTVGDSNQCYSYQDNSWSLSNELLQSRTYASSCPHPFPRQNHRFLVSGGSGLNTTETLTENGWENLLPPLPVAIDQHCSVLFNSSTVLIIGGLQRQRKSSKTYLFSAGNNGWTEGPPLITSRLSKIRFKHSDL
jgi:hypothetical protein